MRAVSLFTGAGGMDIGFSNAGFDIVWANEMMKNAAQTYEANHKSGVMHCGRLETFMDALPTENIDCLFGGPPCQGFSVAGKMSLDDPRSKMVFLFMDALEKIRPRAFVMENVKALAELGKFDTVRSALLEKAKELGYAAFMRVVNAKEAGVPQSRERMFIIGFLDGKDCSGEFDSHAGKQRDAPSVREVLLSTGRVGTPENPNTCNAKIVLAKNAILRKSPYAGMLFNGLGRPLNLDGHSCTLPASMGGNKTPIVDEMALRNDVRPWIEELHAGLIRGEKPFSEVPEHLRRITVREAAALQTFPKDYVFCGPVSSQYTQIGNAVPCKLAEMVASFVLQHL